MESAHIERRNGVYYVIGARISLDSIVYAFHEGCSPETIQEDFDGLTEASVFGAISFYLDHRAEIDAYLRGRQERWTQLDRSGVPPSSELEARLARARQATAPRP